MADSAEDEAERREIWLVAAIVWGLILAMVIGLTAFGVHQSCFNPGPPVVRPMAGTPRAGYCSALQATDPWISLTVLPLLAYLGAALVLRGRRPLWLGLVAAVIAAVVGTNAYIVGSLEFATTF